MSLQKAKRTKIFISYSHRDVEWLERLKVHLRPLQRDYDIDFWDDTRISSGLIWKEEIENAISSCKVAVLLISADFIASDFIATDEVPLLLEAAGHEGALILPVILSPSRFLRFPELSRFQSVNKPDQPLINLSRGEQEAVLDKVAHRIESLFIETSAVASPRVRSTSHEDEKASGVESSTVESSISNSTHVVAGETVGPKFLAELIKDSKGELRRSGKRNNHYEIRLFIKDAPPDTQKVTYELHESYTERIREALKGRRDFEEYITSYGDYIVNVTIHGKRVTKLNDWLTSALENYYGDSASDEILNAIKQLEDR